jgi:hypothetical protein
MACWVVLTIALVGSDKLQIRRHYCHMGQTSSRRFRRDTSQEGTTSGDATDSTRNGREKKLQS